MSDSKLSSFGLLVMRLIVGAIFFYYGSQQLLGWFGGAGFNGTIAEMEDKHRIVPALASLAISANFFGGLGVLLGFLTRLAAFGLVCTMAVAAYFHMPGLKLSDPATVQSLGFPLALFGMNFLLMTTGAGKISVDWKLASRKRKPDAA